MKNYSYLCKRFVDEFDCLQPRKKTLKCKQVYQHWLYASELSTRGVLFFVKKRTGTRLLGTRCTSKHTSHPVPRHPAPNIKLQNY